MFGDLRINKIPIFERAGWQSQPALSKIGILFSCKCLGCVGSVHTPKHYLPFF